MGMDDLGGLADEAKNLASQHPEQADQVLDKVDEAAKKETGGKFSGEIDSAEQKAEGYLGVQGDQQQQQQQPPQQQ